MTPEETQRTDTTIGIPSLELGERFTSALRGVPEFETLEDDKMSRLGVAVAGAIEKVRHDEARRLRDWQVLIWAMVHEAGGAVTISTLEIGHDVAGKELMRSNNPEDQSITLQLIDAPPAV